MRLEKFLWFAFSLAVVSNFLFAFCPPTGDDELAYHLALPLLWAKEGHWTAIPYDFHSYFPLNAEVLYAAVARFGGPLAVKMTVWITGLLATGALWWVLRKHLRFNYLSSLFGVVLFYTMPCITSLNGQTSSDLLCLFFEITALGFLWLPKRKDHLIIAGLLAGLALGTRYQAIPWLFAGGFLAFWFSKIEGLLIFILCTALSFSPWPIHTWLLTGHFLPSDPWLSLLLSRQSEYLFDFLSLPLTWSIRNWIWGIGILPIFLAPFSRCKSTKIFGAMALVYVAVFFIISPYHSDSRQWIGLFPLIICVAVAGFDVLVKENNLFNSLFITLLIPNLLFSGILGAKRIPWFLGWQSTEQYLTRHYKISEGYDMMRYIRDDLPEGTLINLGSLSAPNFYFKDRSYYGMACFYPKFYERTTSELAKAFWFYRIRYVVLEKNSLVIVAHSMIWRYQNSCIQLPRLNPPYFKKIHETQEAVLYEL